MTKELNEFQKLKKLAEKLQQYKFISKFDSDNEPEAWRLAHSLSDLEESFKEILDNYMPALYEADSEAAIQDALLDIGEELRHILYHIKDPKFFDYLFED